MRQLTPTATGLVLGSIALSAVLVGCSAPADAGSAPATGGPYEDGTYTESGSYQSPNGTETIDVTVTLADDIITDVEVVGHGESPDSKLHQGEFIDGIAAIVVGKDIDDISVSKVAGSSLTSGGFTKAIEAIKADAS